MDLTLVKLKLQRKHPLHYKCPKEFVSDVRLVFSNCAKYNEVSLGHVFHLGWGCDVLCMRRVFKNIYTKATQQECETNCTCSHFFTMISQY